MLECPGFVAGGIACGLKKNQVLDVGIILSLEPATVAGVFTRNRVQAAPVVLDSQRVVPGRFRAVVANSGCANCCTGPEGMLDARETARLAAHALGVNEQEVFVASTGVIGKRLDMEKMRASLPKLCQGLAPGGLGTFARAIMTTDTTEKTAVPAVPGRREDRDRGRRGQGCGHDPAGCGHHAVLPPHRRPGPGFCVV